MSDMATINTPPQGRTVAVVGDVYRFLVWKQMFFEVGVPPAEGATTALPPTQDEIEKLMAVAPRYGIEIRLPGN